jgi:hypothetical protein
LPAAVDGKLRYAALGAIARIAALRSAAPSLATPAEWALL